ncbi:MAG: PKD domain-containing protein, partial [Micrococcales bacterium]|nr:PKD domain-containing protein [Micrococcales bacterium]
MACPAAADTQPRDPGGAGGAAPPATVSADALPTVQISGGTVNKRAGGVVWAQAVVGNTVYVGGDFTKARPAGAPRGVDEVDRTYLLAYDITTGVLIDSFNHTLDGQIRAMTLSPDGTRLYIAGDFQQIDGKWRSRIAAFNTADGSLVSGFSPALGSTGQALAATNTTVYVGGDFTKVASDTNATLVARSHLAAFSAATGEVLPFKADANRVVHSLTLTADQSKLVAGGSFSQLSGKTWVRGADNVTIYVYGIGWVDAVTGAWPTDAAGKDWPFQAARWAHARGTVESSIGTLVTHGDSIYGAGWAYRLDSLEGAFRADSTTGELKWLEDCHGDTYDLAPIGDVVYVSSHEHSCAMVPNGFPETGVLGSPTRTYHRATAFTKAVVGENGAPIQGYSSHRGEPAPAQLYWYPDIPLGTYTGMNQGTWSVEATSDYVVYGGEFMQVNGVAQEGLVRFATADKAPNARGPQLSGTNWGTPTLTSPHNGGVRVTMPINWDPDNLTLTYRLYQVGNGAPVDEVTRDSLFWEALAAKQPIIQGYGYTWPTKPPTVVLHDRTAPAGVTQQYQVAAVDAFGNEARSAIGSVKVASEQMGYYAQQVIADQPDLYWRFSDTVATTVRDWMEGDPANGAGMTWKTAGALVGDTDTAVTFNGAGYVSPTTASTPQNRFSIELWIKTPNKNREIFGFGNNRSGTAATYDRSIAVDANGKLTFLVAPGGVQKKITSEQVYTDNAWHHVVATLGADGQLLYVDGVLAASDTSVTTARTGVTGYWRAGGIRATYYLGAMDEVAVYPQVLTSEQIAQHYALGMGTGNVRPTASFVSMVNGLTVSADASASSDADGWVDAYSWDFGDGTTGTGVSPTHAYAAGGTYAVTLTVQDDKGAIGTVTKQVTVTAPPPPGTVLAADTFSRTTTSGWGTAAVGGVWTPDTKAAYFSADGDQASISIPTAGWTSRTRLSEVNGGDVDATVSATVPKQPTAGTTRVWVGARTTSAFDGYLLRATINPNGQVASVEIGKRVAGQDTFMA